LAVLALDSWDKVIRMTLFRAFLRLAPAFLACGLFAAQPVSAEELAFVINSGSASISVIDVEQRKEIRRIPVLREPHHMALTPDHSALLVGDSSGNELLFLDPHTGSIKRRMSISDPYQIAFSPDGRWLVITGLARNQIDLYDARSFELVKRFPAASMPSHINFALDSSIVYVTLQSTNSLIALNLQGQTVLWTTRIGDNPAGVLWHDGKLLVGIMGSDYVAVVDPTDGRVVSRIRTAQGAHVLFVPRDRKVIYVTNRVDGTIVVLDPVTLKEVRRFKVPGGPDDIDFAPDGKLWVTRRWAQSVAVAIP
jgi:YVTN family beta-propeller protein